ncbi:MAG: hypothetical protein ABIQ95_00300, partial [Bdellovibrionia bacterium]
MKKTWIISAFIALAALNGCKYYDGIPVIGVDSKGNPSQVFVPEKDYSNRVLAMVSTVNDSALLALNRQKIRPGFMLRTVTIGVAAN